MTKKRLRGAEWATLAVMAIGNACFGDEPVPHQMIVTLHDGFAIEDLIADYPEVGPIEILASIAAANTHLLQIPEDAGEDEFEELIENDPRVEEAEDNEEFETVEGQTQSFYLNVLPSAFAGQPAFETIELPAVASGSEGSGVVVALLDTGIDPKHPLLAGMIVEGGWNFVGGNDDVLDVGNDLDEDDDGLVDEMVGHGTFVAGLIAGIAPSAGILPVKVLNSDGRGDLFAVAQGIYHAVDQGADVINLSLAVEDGEEFLADSIDYAVAAGVPVIVAAGNLDSDDDMYLVKETDTIGVAGTDDDDVRCDFSNFAEEIALSAPACAVVSTVPGDGYAEWEGTSMSAAMTSAAAALVLSVAPDLSPAELEAALASSAADIDGENPDFAGLLGSGRLDLAAAVDSVAGPSADLDGDGDVDVTDLVLLIGSWGQSDPDYDLDGDGTVGVGDLIALINAWG